MARPPSEHPKNVTLQLRVTEATAKQIDRLITGTATRTDWLRLVVWDAVQSGQKVNR